MPPSVLYLGWDVGGWEGARDGVAVLRAGADGRLRPAASATRVALKPLIGSGELCVAELLGVCGCAEPWERAVLGIDAPLGWPAEFIALVAETPASACAYLPDPGLGEMDNHLAYRWCDRVIRRVCGKKPLSATFDRLGNNCTKAIAARRLLAAGDGATMASVGASAASVTMLEAYPALWKTGGGKTGGLIAGAATALAGCDLPPAGSDELDAVLCALTAACYDNRIRDLGLGLPNVAFPEDFAHLIETPLQETVALEGWAYFPLDAVTRGGAQDKK